MVEDGRVGEAEPVFRQALEQLRKSVPDTDWRVGLAKSWLGGCLVDLGRRREARPFLKEGYETLRADIRTGKDVVEAARKRLARLG